MRWLLVVPAVLLTAACATNRTVATPPASTSPPSTSPAAAPSTPAAASSATSSAAPSPSRTERTGHTSVPPCGSQIDALLNPDLPLSLTGQFPAHISGAGGGAFSGSVTLTNNGTRMSAATTPEADVVITHNGQVVATAVPKDMLARIVDLPTGASHTFAARAAARNCASPGGETLSPGHYELFGVVVLTQSSRSPIIITGGPWPLEITS